MEQHHLSALAWKTRGPYRKANLAPPFTYLGERGSAILVVGNQILLIPRGGEES